MTRSERARERETHRYYQTWLESARGHLTPKNVSRDDPLTFDATSSRDEATQKISRDKALVAFAQLAALRLNVKRAMVILISTSTAYILAEATRTLSLLSGGQHAEGDELWIGTGSLPRNESISEKALDPPMYTASSSAGQVCTAPALVIEDMSKDSRSTGKAYVGNRASFYAGVPITSKSGFTIGVLALTDDRTRSGLSSEELLFLQDIATTITDHLENIRNDAARHRGERMVLGLGAFTEGKATMDPEHKDGDSVTSARDTLSQNSTSSLQRPTLNGITVTELDQVAFRNMMERNESPDGEGRNDIESGQEGEIDPNQRDNADYVQKSSNSAAGSSGATVRPKSHRITTDAPIEGSPAGIAAANHSSMPLRLRETFARAANILRQATGSDGVMFFDAQSANVGRSGPDLFRNDSTDANTSSDENMSTSGTSSDDPEDDNSSPANRAGRGNDQQNHDHRKQSGPRNCEMLGYSFRLSSVAQLRNQSGLVLKERELNRFLRRYPHGLVIHFTKDGEVSSSDDSSPSTRNKDWAKASPQARPGMTPVQREKKRIIAKELIKVVPGARNVIFFGLWDFSKARWSAGCFVWSSQTARLLNAQEDLVYMKAFANTVMGETQRLEAVASDQAKTSFVANVSHELRSPLHGILGSIEFLQDTAVDPFQASMITTVETCGKTLLDTVNHVLEFAKLSKRSQRESTRALARENTVSVPSNLDMDIDLATVVEEVVEAIYAGQTFRSTGAFHGNEDESRALASPAPKSASTLPAASVQSKFAGTVRLLLDIEKLDSWWVRTQPGAVRRIVMNLLGNALKYTERGLVCVSLHSSKSNRRKRSELAFSITVADTGKGMSIDFAQNHAWQAFSQEDSFATGVGLGLSIVRHITSSLGGTIDLQSAKGKGTEMKISLAVPPSSSPVDDSQTLTSIVSRRVRGLTLCILDPGYEMTDGPDAELYQRIEDTFRRLITSWFGMKVSKADSVDGSVADIFIYINPPSAEHMLLKHGVGTANIHAPLIIITSNAFESANLRKDTRKLKELGKTIDIISQPCGPQKLARSFERCIYQEPFATSSDAENTSLAAVRIDGGSAGPAAPFHSQDPRLENDTPAQNTESRKSKNIRSGSITSMPASEAPTEPLSESAGEPVLSRFGSNTFPSSVASASVEDKPGAGAESPDTTLRPVLLVDDNDVNLKLLVAFVRKAKFPYETAQDGQQALDLYREASKDPNRAFRAVVIDVQMPVMDGITATREIRKFEAKSRIEPPANIVALTGLASIASQREAFEAGVDHFLPKPVRFKEFLKFLEQ